MIRFITDRSILKSQQMIVHPSATFEQGTIGQLSTHGNQIVCAVSDGLRPFGIIDDVRTTAHSNNIINEEHLIIPSPSKISGFQTNEDIIEKLDEAGLVTNSFVSSYQDLLVDMKHGIVTIPAGSDLNYDADGDGNRDSIRFFVSYSYFVPNYIGEDSTSGTGKVTVVFDKMIFETSVFETNQIYPLGGALYVSQDGKLTTRKHTDSHPAVGQVFSPPSSYSGMLQVYWW